MIEWIGVGNIKKLRERLYAYEQVLVAYDRQMGRCAHCGAGPLEDFETHHVRPRRIGGGNEHENLEIVCQRKTGTGCHQKREDRSARIYGLGAGRPLG